METSLGSCGVGAKRIKKRIRSMAKGKEEAPRLCLNRWRVMRSKGGKETQRGSWNPQLSWPRAAPLVCDSLRPHPVPAPPVVF